MQGLSSGPIKVNNGQAPGTVWVASSDSINVKYTYIGWKWSSTKAANGIPYWINRTNFSSANYDTAAARATIVSAFAAWDAISGADLTFTFMGYDDNLAQNGNDEKNVITWETQGNDGLTHWVGNPSGSLTDCDISLRIGGWADGSLTNLKVVMVHEIGHFLGLGDLGGRWDRESQRTMYLRAADIGNQAPASDDADGIRRIYGKWSGTLRSRFKIP